MEHATPSDGHAGSGPDYDAWFRREVQIGLDQANAGMLIPGEEIEAEAALWRAQMQRKMADAVL